MSEKKDQEYFSDGLSEELIDMLTKLPELRVPARTSSFYFKGKQVTIADIAKALGVAHILEGSVRKSGNTLRVTAQLIRADDGYHVWSETYDRKLQDIFKVQDEIATAVVTALKVHLLPMQKAAEQEELRTENLEAYNLYLQSRQSFNQSDIAGIMGLSCYLLLAGSLAAERSAANQSTPILLAHGLADPIVAPALGEHARATLEACGYAVEWHTYPMPHSVCPEEVADIAQWLRRVL